MSKMAVLEELALKYVGVTNDSNLSDRRRDRDQSVLMVGMLECLKPVARKIATRKNMLSNEDEVQQHTMIAIMKAMENWDHTIASFSTHVHYHIQWELGSFEHYAFPERRRIKVKQPIRFLELDRPVKGDDGEDASCMLDFLVDENAESNIEDSFEHNQMLDYLQRVMGVYVDLRWRSMRKLETGRLTQEKEVITLCRNIDIYLQTRINGITHASLSIVHGITRERVRQIVSTVELAVKDYLPTKDDESDDYHPPVKLYAGEQSKRWDIIASWYWHATEREIRHTANATIMPYEDVLQYLPPIITAECKKMKNDALVVERQTTVERSAKKQAKRSKAENSTTEVKTPVDDLPRTRSARSPVKLGKTKQLTMPFMAAAALMSTAAGAQTSRAIPPTHDVSTVSSSQTKQTNATVLKPTIPVRDLRTGKEAGTGYGNQWAVKLDAYQSKTEADAAAAQFQNKYPKLQNAVRAKIDDPQGQVWLSYGPYRLPQAKSLCVAIMADKTRCTVVRLST